MEKTLNLPDDLADRLSRREAELERILELGLQIVEREDSEIDTGAAGSADDEVLPAILQDVLNAHMNQRRRASVDSPLDPAELIAYHRGELEPVEEERLLDRLTLDHRAVRDLVDWIEFDREETRSAKEQQKTTEALHSFRARVGGSASRSRRYRQVVLAAGLAVAFGAAWTLGLVTSRAKVSGPRYAAVIDVAASRGARPFPVSEDAQEILLILPLDAATGTEMRTLQITGIDGGVVYQETFRVTEDHWSRLYLALPRDHLAPGTYRLEVTTAAAHARPEDREYRFAIENPASR